MEISTLANSKNNGTLLQSAGADLQSKSIELLASENLSIDSKQLLTSLKTAGDVLASGDAGGIQAEDLDGYLKADSAWAELFNLNFDKAVELRKSLVSIRSLSN